MTAINSQQNPYQYWSTWHKKEPQQHNSWGYKTNQQPTYFAAT